jgi:ribonuclease-3
VQVNATIGRVISSYTLSLSQLRRRLRMKKSAKKKKVSHGLEVLETKLGHRFARPELLQDAVTHSSHANELAADSGSGDGRVDNEQLEFLGDAVLGFVTSRLLFDRYPDYNEGQLSKTRAHLVSAKHLIKVARQLQLGTYLRLGRGEERSGGRSKAALLVDALEAVIASLYLDGGLDAARHFVVSQILQPELDAVERDPDLAFSDQKSALQEWLQATGGQQPAYHLVQEEGPDHRKTFTVELRLTPAMSGDPSARSPYVCRAQGSTKKNAEQKVAQQALRYLQKQKRDAQPI